MQFEDKLFRKKQTTRFANFLLGTFSWRNKFLRHARANLSTIGAKMFRDAGHVQ